VDGLDVWDMWPIARSDGSTLQVQAQTFWFFLAARRLEDPEDRHGEAHIRLTSHSRDGWSDLGRVFPPGFTPGSREWSGSATLDDAGRNLTMFYTAAGRRGGPLTFEQRLFQSHCAFRLDGGKPVLGAWSTPIECVQADGSWYARADEVEAPPHGVKGFRDPAYFRDAADGSEYLLFTGSAAWAPQPFDGVIGAVKRERGDWSLLPPLIEALGVNSELERPHAVFRDGLYYLFWSTRARRFAPELGAPTGLYAMTAHRFQGPWRPVNGSGLVAANPIEAPLQAYCWWVTAEGQVLSFVDYSGASGIEPPADKTTRRNVFGGTAAPAFHLAFAGDRVKPISS
jgi:levansucrase